MRLRRSSPPSESVELAVERLQQPDELTCGPTSLLQLYRFYGFPRTLDEVIRETRRNPDGGTLAVYLGLSALGNGFVPAIYSYNFSVFDPTWRGLEPAALAAKLRERSEWVESERLRRITLAYAELVERGGEVRFDELGRGLLVELLRGGQPILTGLSATYLYAAPRELDEVADDVGGDPVGHFVVISGYDAEREEFVVCDPSIHTPFTPTGRYRVAAERLIVSIVLGGATDDAVLLVLGPRPPVAPDRKDRESSG